MFTNRTIYNLLLFSSAYVPSEAKIAVAGDQRRKEGHKTQREKLLCSQCQAIACVLPELCAIQQRGVVSLSLGKK